MVQRVWFKRQNQKTGDQIHALHDRRIDSLWKAKAAAKLDMQAAHDEQVRPGPDIKWRDEYQFATRTVRAAKLNARLANRIDLLEEILSVLIARLMVFFALAEKGLLDQSEVLLKVSEPAIRLDPEPRTSPPPLEHRPTIQPNAPALI